ncbi:MAG: MmgE/PrpD family protein [Deltaproteobacteria bacterium HGW-Deltaproteobacteria-15]|jgi:2-methylcitrate dehydratase PrpD|nr:MAG: MmgE/PrpD family protein [Deltaproteobacteria bacterium HGW-Deltaproteobacteria-15]
MEIARKVASLALGLHLAALDEPVLDRIKYLLLDHLGVAIRGSQTDSSHAIQRFLSSNHDTSRGVPVIGTRMRAEASFAAMANGTGAHSLELDDVVNAASLHPAVTIIPAALSAGCLAGCSGRELLESIIAGYELTIKLGVALNPAAHYGRGFHPTATCGTFGAALAAARILKLDADKIARALGIAGSQTSGSMEFLADGSFTKRFHAGWAAHAGLIAALLAREGFTGPTSIFEGRFGFLHAYSPVSDPDKVLAGWGNPYEVMKTSIKPHACCRYKQGPIDCILQIVRENRLTENDIEKVVVSVLKAGFAIVSEPREHKLNPQTIVDAQFSMPFGAAVAILYGRAFLDQYCMENISSPRVRELMRRVICIENQEIEKEFPARWPAQVEITTRDGRSFRSAVEHPKGDPENPLSWDEIIEKFFDLASSVLSKKQCGAIVDRVRAMEEETDVNRLMEILAPG